MSAGMVEGVNKIMDSKSFFEGFHNDLPVIQVDPMETA